MSQQMYKIIQGIAGLGQVALEDQWAGLSAVPLRSIRAISQIKAFFVVFREFREGKIIGQRNYDCYAVWK
jgi:hypothetical protein